MTLVLNLGLLPASCVMMAASKPDLRLLGHICPRLCPIGSSSCAASMAGHHGEDASGVATGHQDDVAAAGHHDGDADSAACHCDKLGGDHTAFLALGGSGIAVLTAATPPQSRGGATLAPAFAETVRARAVTPTPRPPNA